MPTHLLELGLPQQLGENVSQVISSGNMAGLDAPILQTIPDEVILDVDVLAFFMEYKVLGQSQDRLAIHLQLNHIHLLAKEL